MAPSSLGLQAASVLDELPRRGVTHSVWLPDSETGFMYQAMLSSPITLVPVCREGESMPIAAGLIMGGQRPVVLPSTLLMTGPHWKARCPKCLRQRLSGQAPGR